jgi:very-short-patch-repair endonuclease
MNKPKLETSDRRRWPVVKEMTRRMRLDPTHAEAVLWSHLRGGQLGVRFRRQHAVDRFIVDFYCPAARLIVEVDGPIHQAQLPRDRERDLRLSSQGYCLLRFTNAEVEEHPDLVVNKIRSSLLRRSEEA